MTTASAQDRVEELAMRYRLAQRDLVEAVERCDEALREWSEARALSGPQFQVGEHDDRSTAERQRDRDQAFVERGNV